MITITNMITDPTADITGYKKRFSVRKEVVCGSEANK